MQKFIIVYMFRGTVEIRTIEVSNDTTIFHKCEEYGITRDMISHILVGEAVFLTNW